jgi:D-beta-D-heptose 7-phosphate kinase/D-beta-D-heptose 1-phosphate adenosyltransferase
MSQSTLVDLLPRLHDRRVAVVGDLMLDRYIWGRASRISQEAPVPVVHVSRESTAPGGAANVVRNILSLGGTAEAFGVTGDDQHGQTLVEQLAAAGAVVDGMLVTPDRPTTVKTRVIAGTQQVVRIDREDTSPLDRGAQDRMLERLEHRLSSGEIHAVILEDYAKGLLTRDFAERIILFARERGIPVALDPHSANAFNVRGLSLMTPNRTEAFALAGIYHRSGVLPIAEDRPLLDVGRRLRELWAPELLLITLGGDGMALFRGEQEPLHIPTRAREVFDVSGAGDTVMAACVLALAAGASPADAADLANHAAGIVVGEVGTAAVTAEELRLDLERSNRE